MKKGSTCIDPFLFFTVVAVGDDGLPSTFSMETVLSFGFYVQVEIYAANGALLEAGDAVQSSNGLDWTYTTTQANNPLAGSKVIAIATDVPGNEGTLELTV